MHLKPNWRILTIGDGDLSFSAALWKAFKPQQLTASVLDSQNVLENKYQHHAIEQLQKGSKKQKASQQVLFGFDVTNPDTWPEAWKALKNRQFDLVIFQFPLVPAFEDPEYFHKMGDISVNTINRLLLRKFLIHCQQYFLDPEGPQLCYITSKDVKPYCEWNIENSLNQGLDSIHDLDAIHYPGAIHYLGSMPFDINLFPGYKIRNVDRDKHVKDTQGITYVWSPKKEQDEVLLAALEGKSHQGNEYCEMCKAGPFVSNSDKLLHEQTKKHRLMQQYEDQYSRAIATTD